MTTAAEKWVDSYVRAWTTNEPDDIRAVFTEKAATRGGRMTRSP